TSRQVNFFWVANFNLKFGVVEVTKVGQQIIDSNRLTIPTASFWIYGTILVLYFAVCYPISKLSTHLEKHWRN
ncbi:hypothetical protein, partial [Streptococcus pneumoniae]